MQELSTSIPLRASSTSFRKGTLVIAAYLVKLASCIAFQDIQRSSINTNLVTCSKSNSRGRIQLPWIHYHAQNIKYEGLNTWTDLWLRG